jgi:hypothetical protein
MQDIQELKNSIGQIDSKLNVREKGTFLAQPQPNPKTQFVVNKVQNPHIKHVKEITTLRSGKVIEKDISKKVLPSKENQETKDDDGLMTRKIKKMRKESTNLLHLFLKLFSHIKRRKQIKIF